MKANIQRTTRESISEAARLLARGELIVWCTDTVYGIAAGIRFPEAIRRVYEVKGRSFSEALQVAMPPADVPKHAAVDPWQHEVMSRLLPAPISFIVPNKAVPTYVNSGLSTVCIGWQNEGIMRQLYDESGGPYIGTSANPHGSPSAVRVEQVAEYFGDRIPLYLDGGTTKFGVPNTIIDLTSKPISMLRKGPLDISEIERMIAERVKVPRSDRAAS
jgi:L-threonylcarbamoyladenylate synthase